MKTIEQVISELQKSLTGVRIKTGESIAVEIWTIDGRIVSDSQRGVKVTVPLKQVSSRATSETE